MPKLSDPKRNAAIVAARKRGDIYPKIAEHYGITSARARQIVQEHERRALDTQRPLAPVEAPPTGTLADLSTRARNCLINDGYASGDDPTFILRDIVQRHLRAMHLSGPKTAAEIWTWLCANT